MPEELPLSEPPPTSEPAPDAPAPAAQSAPEVESEPASVALSPVAPESPPPAAEECSVNERLAERLADAFARVLIALRALEHAARIAPSTSLRRAEAHLADAAEWLRDAGVCSLYDAAGSPSPFVAEGGESFVPSLVAGLDGVGQVLEDLAFNSVDASGDWRVGRAAYSVHSGVLHLRAHLRRN